jgi:hypothetical protein
MRIWIPRKISLDSYPEANLPDTQGYTHTHAQVCTVALHVTAIRVYIPSLLPSSSSSKHQVSPGNTNYTCFDPLFCCVVFAPFPSLELCLSNYLKI